MAWSRAALMEWFQQHSGRRVTIGMEGGSYYVRGLNHGVDRVDACSTEYHTADLELADRRISVSLTFHDHSLGIHVMGKLSGGQEADFSLPANIPYDQLRVREEDGSRQDADQDQDEPFFSPYELL